MQIRDDTHYNIKLLHGMFAGSALLLLTVTIVWLVKDRQRPWKDYQSEASRVLERYGSRGSSGLPRAVSQSAPGEAERFFGPPFAPSWDRAIAIRAIEVPGFRQDSRDDGPRHMDRCITCHALIDWPEGPRASLEETDAPTFNGILSQASIGPWDIPTGAVPTARPVVVRDSVLHVWLPLVPLSRDRGNAPAKTVTAKQPAIAQPSPSVSHADIARRRWGIILGEVRKAARHPANASGVTVMETAPHSPGALAGLRSGDIILEVGDSPISNAASLIQALDHWTQAAQSAASSECVQSREFPTAAALQRRARWVRLTVQRGVPNPWMGHPRPDLYLRADSPHPVEGFACTICHEGQGLSLDFVHTGHFPKSLTEARRWQQELSWQPEQSCRCPMPPAALIQRSCLACHPNVFDLVERGDPVRPAAELLLKGRRAFERYGCYGCHDVSDPAAPHPSDPGLLRQPSYRGTAAQLLTLDSLPAEVREAATVYLSGNDDRVRHQLTAKIATWLATSSSKNRPGEDADKEAALPASPADRNSLFARAEAARLLRVLRIPRHESMFPPRGPSLRYVAQRRDRAYIASYIANPGLLRPDSLMPRLFALLGHVGREQQEVLARYEDVEIEGMAAYLTATAQTPPAVARPLAANTPPLATTVGRPDSGTDMAWGRLLFETQGCLACHRHPDFPEAKSTFGPDLAGLVARWDFPARLTQRRTPQDAPPTEVVDRLAAWLDNPLAWSLQTRMPRPQFRAGHWLVSANDPNRTSSTIPEDLPQREPLQDRDATRCRSPFQATLAAGESRRVMLRALAGYLLSSTEPARADIRDGRSSFALPVPKRSLGEADIDAVFREYAENQVPAGLLAEAVTRGLPPDAWTAIPLAAWGDVREIASPLDREKKLRYIGRRALRRHGCHGCHDIPGLEDAGPIGPPLIDWGAKQPEQLAFEHINNYLAEAPAGRTDQKLLMDHDGLPLLLLASWQREGWLYQKLVSPRSYDYNLDAKRFTERLRMGQWPFSSEERMALVCFVTGLRRPTIPPQLRPPPKTADILARGRAMIERLGCDQCHLTHFETWRIECDPRTLLQWRGTANDQGLPQAYQADAAEAVDARGLTTLDLVGAPQRNGDGVIVAEEDDWGRPLYFFRLRRPALIAGELWPVDGPPLPISEPQITFRSPQTGGAFSDLLHPILLRRIRAQGLTAGDDEVWGWTPPALAHIGAAVRPDWLWRYLMSPYPIRPNVPLAMPHYALTHEQAELLTAYLQAIAQAPPDRTPSSGARREKLARKQAEDPDYLEGAFRILTDTKTYCGKCHSTGGQQPSSASPITTAPRLDTVAERLRADYVRAWVANPRAILPYTAMPTLFPAGGSPLDRSVMDRSSHEQMAAVLDLLSVLSEYLTSRCAPPPDGALAPP